MTGTLLLVWLSSEINGQYQLRYTHCSAYLNNDVCNCIFQVNFITCLNTKKNIFIHATT